MFNIIEKKKIFFAIPCIIILAGIICFFVFGGLNADIDFTGGTAMEISLGKEFNETEIRDSIAKVKDVNVSSVQSSGNDSAIVKTSELSHDKLVEVQEAISKAFPDSNIKSTDSVSATIGNEMWWSSFKAIILAVILMLVYIWIRFELFSGIAAVLALCHDVLIIISIYAIFRLPINTSFIAAILTILGYSINATIVIFDRIRENLKLSKKDKFSEIVNKSIWQTVARSINTSATTLVTLICLYIFGVQSIKQFALPLIIGVLCGTYSSVFISGSLWVLLRGNKSN